jgi:hypothetical protein
VLTGLTVAAPSSDRLFLCSGSNTSGTQGSHGQHTECATVPQGCCKMLQALLCHNSDTPEADSHPATPQNVQFATPQHPNGQFSEAS